MTHRARAAAGVAERRFVRVMVLCLGVAAAAFAAVVGGPIATQAAHEQPVWVVGSIVVVFALPIAVAVVALAGRAPAGDAVAVSSPGPLPRERLVRAGLVAVTAGFLLALLTLEPALLDGSLPPEAGAPWILGITPLAAATAALVLPPVAAWAYSLTLAALVAVDRILAFPGSIVDVALQDALVALLLQSVFQALTLATLRAARTLDTAASTARQEAVALARATARAREESRVDALLHDTVLATLLLAAREPDARGAASPAAADTAPLAHRERAADLARRGLAEIDRVRSGSPGAPTALTARQLVWRLQAVTTDLDPYAEVSAAVADELTVPAAVADAIADAATEALRNSVLHAGEHASRLLVVDARAASVHVAVLDDGVGFDPAAVGSERLGLRVSLTERMAALPGGRATIASQPGDGTSVVLEWRADAAR